MSFDLPNKDAIKVMLDRAMITTRATMPLGTLLASRGEIFQRFDMMMQALIFDLDTYVLAMPDEEIRVDEQYPADWWEAFKERWFPAWALRRWPVVYREIFICEKRYKAVCPHIDAPFGNHIHFMVQHTEPTMENLTKKADLG